MLECELQCDGQCIFLGTASQKRRPPVGNKEGTGTHRTIPGISYCVTSQCSKNYYCIRVHRVLL